VLLKKAAGITKGSATPHTVKVGSVTRAQLREIAEAKFKDMNANDIEGAIKQLEGTPAIWASLSSKNNQSVRGRVLMNPLAPRRSHYA
jgi:hypothetical protein